MYVIDKELFGIPTGQVAQDNPWLLAWYGEAVQGLLGVIAPGRLQPYLNPAFESSHALLDS